MRIAISKIKVTKRIRKDIRNVKALANDIRRNGLICPIAVMPTGEGFQLLAGLRRLRAIELNGETEIEANIISASDAEDALDIEYAENEQRESFTFSEQMDYARLIEEIERVKSAERQAAGVKIAEADLPAKWPEGSTRAERETRYIVGKKIGMIGRQYDRAKFIADNAPPVVIEQLDRGERTIRSVYDAMRGITKTGLPSETEPPVKKPRLKSADFEKLQADYAALKTKSDETFGKYAAADKKREMLETQLQNTHLQWDYEREGKNSHIAELTAALETANARIAVLEATLDAARARIQELETEPTVSGLRRLAGREPQEQILGGSQ